MGALDGHETNREGVERGLERRASEAGGAGMRTGAVHTEAALSEGGRLQRLRDTHTVRTRDPDLTTSPQRPPPLRQRHTATKTHTPARTSARTN